MSNLRLPEAEYAALCKAVLLRDKYRCRSCGMRSGLHVHHVIFRSRRGPDAAWNLVTLCSACHDGVHKDVEDGLYGLIINFTNNSTNNTGAETLDGIYFIRRPGWKPQ
jgi:5-methylcytosine-specific restriction endonuclease McrA